jgi:hypothetical protein
MKTETLKRINVAPSSDEGHFIEDAKQVIDLDVVNETFAVKGAAKLVTKNHTTLVIEEDCIITCQQVFDPFKNIRVKSKD